MNLGLTNKVALVTAGSRGLGRATVLSLLNEGAKVLVVARQSDALNDVGAIAPEQCKILAGDLLDPALPQKAVDMALAYFGSLDVAIINTPGPRPIMPLEAEDTDFADAFESTFYPAVRLVKLTSAAMRKTGRGRIVIISSTSVKAPKPFLSLSAAARSALWAWAKSAVPELYQDGVTVNAIFAGPHETERAAQLGVKDRVIGQPQDFGNFVTSLCGDATRFITGSSFIVDGGELRGI
jgi:3-oxoacyl-[acyl-carrier protein] reductase